MGTLEHYVQGARVTDISVALDSAPAGEDRYTVTKVITNAKRELARTVRHI